jgi:hypothetical protein
VGFRAAILQPISGILFSLANKYKNLALKLMGNWIQIDIEVTKCHLKACD